MSQGSFMETIRLQIRQRIALGFHTLVLVPGNYGEKFAQSLGGILNTSSVHLDISDLLWILPESRKQKESL